MRSLYAALSLGVSTVVAVAACGESAPGARVASAPPASAVPVIVPAPSASAEGAPDAASDAPDDVAVAVATPADAGPHVPACAEQQAQAFLIRSAYIANWNAPAEERKRAAEAHKEAIRYRTEQYGYAVGFGKPEWNAHPPTFYVEETSFMDLPVKMHKRVIPALKCVEAAIKATCTDKPYTPRALAGIRYKNTFQGGEITNHMYGIAIDIDPSLNSCCGCVKPWNQDPRCFKKVTTEYERMVMPECWVHVFEKYGFYWLGHDVLQDTMHFDFLGDPEKIMQ